VRHVLPVYVTIAMLGAMGWMRLATAERGRPWTPLAAGVLLAWLAWTGIRQHPDYLAYFNELASGRPEDVLADSDLDWGQNAKRAAARLRELGATEVSVFLSGNFEQDQYTCKMNGFPPLRPFLHLTANPGWNVISPTSVAVFVGGWNSSKTVIRDGRPVVLRPWYEMVEPTERVGSLLLYYNPPAAAQRPVQPIQ
jgi:hypothetical protein